MQFLISSVSIDSRGMRSSALPQRASPPLIPRPLASYGQKQSTRKRPVFPRSSWRASNKSDAGKGKALGYSRAEHGHRRRCGSSSGGGPLKKTTSAYPSILGLFLDFATMMGKSGAVNLPHIRPVAAFALPRCLVFPATPDYGCSGCFFPLPVCDAAESICRSRLYPT
jgi:hypothetical protein